MKNGRRRGKKKKVPTVTSSSFFFSTASPSSPPSVQLKERILQVNLAAVILSQCCVCEPMSVRFSQLFDQHLSSAATLLQFHRQRDLSVLHGSHPAAPVNLHFPDDFLQLSPGEFAKNCEFVRAADVLELGPKVLLALHAHLHTKALHGKQESSLMQSRIIDDPSRG